MEMVDDLTSGNCSLSRMNITWFLCFSLKDCMTSLEGVFVPTNDCRNSYLPYSKAHFASKFIGE